MYRRGVIAAMGGVIGAFVMPDMALGQLGDDTVSLQTAMNGAVAEGLPLVLEPRDYVCRQLKVPNGLVMVASTAGGYGIGIGPHARISLKAGTNDHLLFGGPDVAHVRITGVHLDANKNNNSKGCAIYLAKANTPVEAQWHIRDCFIEAAADCGIFVGAGRRAVQISDCTLNYNGSYGIGMYGSDSHIDRCIVGSNGVAGIGVGGAVTDINGCDIYNNKTGIAVFSTITKVMIRGNRIDRQSRGVLVSSRCKDVMVTNNVFHSNATDIKDESGVALTPNNLFGDE